MLDPMTSITGERTAEAIGQLFLAGHTLDHIVTAGLVNDWTKAEALAVVEDRKWELDLSGRVPRSQRITSPLGLRSALRRPPDAPKPAPAPQPAPQPVERPRPPLAARGIEPEVAHRRKPGNPERTPVRGRIERRETPLDPPPAAPIPLPVTRPLPDSHRPAWVQTPDTAGEPLPPSLGATTGAMGSVVRQALTHPDPTIARMASRILDLVHDLEAALVVGSHTQAESLENARLRARISDLTDEVESLRNPPVPTPRARVVSAHTVSKPIEHGTERGARQHAARHIALCGECQPHADAIAARMRSRKPS